jgi:LPS-assembly protein
MADGSSRYFLKTLGFVLSLLLFLVLSPQQGLTQPRSLMKEGLDSQAFMTTLQGTWSINADSISYDQNNETYEATGNVRVTSEDRSIQADWALLNMKQGQVELRGRVLLRYGKNWLQGEHVFWNLDTETGQVDGGLLYFAENNFYIQGRTITKIGPNEYELKDGFLTSCDPADSDWKLRYRNMNVNLDGIAWATHTSFWIKSIPILYSPLLALPVDRKRQSGFLIPWAGFSDLNGFEAEVPFFWAIRDDMDATFYARYMEKRGWMAGLEYRVSSQTFGEGIWLFNYLRDQASEQHIRNQGFPFETRDRFWVRSRHSFQLPYEIDGRLDLDLVSDRSFLQEFSKGSASYGYTNREFRQFLGRGILNDERTQARESSIFLEKKFESSLITLDTRYWDQLDLSRDEFTLQRLPSLSYNIIPSWVDGYPLYYTLESSLVNYWRRQGDRGNRLDLHPRVYAPLHWKNYIDVEPSLGLRGTSYIVDWEEQSHGAWQGRLMPDFRLELSSRLNKVYPVDIGNFVAVEHGIRPEILYGYTPDELEGDIPRFDRLDARQLRNNLRYGFSNFLTTKEVRQDAAGETVTTYRELARLKLFQTFNFEEALSDTRFGVEEDEGFTPIGMRLDMMPSKLVSFSYDTDLYSPDLGFGSYHDIFMILRSGTGHSLRFDYQFRNDLPVDEFITELRLRVLPNVYLSSYQDYSFDQKEMFKQGYGVRYLHGCWSIGLNYEKEANDQRVSVSLNLLGLGTLGGRFTHEASETLTEPSR